ncbi:MAG: DUF5682 family protein, partial [Planctomycetota bacterium]
MTRLRATDAQVVYFPVRHHSPAAAALVKQWIQENRPQFVLIEGPSDYNEYLDELFLGHKLPIAIYSYFRTTDLHSGVYYPFCDYSPEWLALCEAKRANAGVRFIDLPWSESEGDERQTHRYADAELRRGKYVSALCERLHVDGFDDLWDRMIESQLNLSIDEYFARTHEFCLGIRSWEDDVSISDRRRESFMAAQIDQALQQASGQVLVVTGGFHSSALVALVEGLSCVGLGLDDPKPRPDGESRMIRDKGVALTTYSYQRLDGLRGYNAGMPNPGFYRHVWKQRNASKLP